MKHTHNSKTLRTGTWAELKNDAAPVRVEVFVQEQKIPIEEEWDEADHKAVHAVAYDRSGRAVATGRLLAAEAKVAKIGRMAVLKSSRGTGVGRQVLEALLEAARQRCDQAVRLSAQLSAEGFYRRQGFVPVGQPYDEVGIPHIAMEMRL